MKRINPLMAVMVGYLSLFAMYLICGYCCLGIVQAQDRQIVIPDGPQLIADKLTPMEYAAGLLQQMYLKPVTYEDPILSWSGDTDQVPNSVGGMITIPKRRSFAMPDEANPRKNPTLDARLLKGVVDAYHEQTNGPRFRVASSRWGLHLIPDQVRDRSGRFVRAIAFLDTLISVPVEKRTPSGHFIAICSAVSASTATGIKLNCHVQYVDGYFSQARIPRIPTDEEMEKISFAWGIEQVAARDALIDLLERSATTLTWHLLCDARPECGLNIVPMEVNYMGSDGKPFRTALSHDRKKRTD